MTTEGLIELLKAYPGMQVKFLDTMGHQHYVNKAVVEEDDGEKEEGVACIVLHRKPGWRHETR